MHFLIALALVSVVASQRNPWNDLSDYFNQNKLDYTIDFVHNYRFEEHAPESTNKHLLVAISDTASDRSCHIIEVSASWTGYLDNEEAIKAVTEEIYRIISTHSIAETELTRDQLRQKYGDNEALNECYNHKVYELVYNPSFEKPTPPPTTARPSTTPRPTTA